MKLGDDGIALLEAFSEPVLLISPEGIVLHANRPAEALIGRRVGGEDLAQLHTGDVDALQVYLKRCLGSRQAIVGALILELGHGLEKIQCRGSLVSADGTQAILVRLSRADEVRFVALKQKVDELGRQLSERQRTKALLEEALRERELLLRELQHRVKNNMHMLAAMLSGAERESTSPEAKAALKDASLRFSAVSAVQQLLYSSEGLETIGTRELVETLMAGLRGMAHRDLETELTVDPIELPVDAALPLALLLNELLTNAVKYGLPAEGNQKITVTLLVNGDAIDVAVRDNGPGFDLAECRKRASGIGLVRGLLRQLGGSFQVKMQNGSCCTVTFPDPRSKTSERKAA